ncbi:MAG: dTMP kinase [Candidatus Yonathbacteria bacterium]|nr:dTMP kinase [Candidatus Yonathbacteria bacterium]
MTIKKAPLIIIDGIDGSGKTTQANLLKERLSDGQVVFTRQPGGTPLSEKIRDVFSSSLAVDASPQTQFFLMWASRADWLEQVVIPNIEKGIPVISNRGGSSTYAYQVYAREAHDLEEEFWRTRALVMGKHKPRMYIIIDIPAKEARRRMDADESRIKSLFDVKPLEFHERARAGFRAFAKKLPGEVIILDGMRDRDVIHKEVFALVSEICGW